MEEMTTEGTQPAPEGETVENPGIVSAPEQKENTAETLEHEDTGEEPAEAPAEPEVEQPKPEKKKLSWETRRINELTAKRREAEQRAAELEAENGRLRGIPAEERTTENTTQQPSVEEIRRQEREAIRREEQIRIDTDRFNQACNATFEKGVADIPDFVDARDTLMNSLGDEVARKPEFLQIITELDNGHQVFAELGRNPEEAERILRLTPVKMALEIAKMGDKLAKPVVKPVSKVPAPVTPIGGKTTVASRLDDPDVSMDKFANEYLKMLAPKGR
ncbi:hypothetical protein ACTJJ7_16305 [Phyllobacterium sp. 22229]|uniref:hypothetical protein n=1 Tax=Phyllobacterium sp. 22229 TaxID=3453895 RepID=UPI003F83FC98